MAVLGFWVPKKGSTADEYEDAFAISKDGRRFAIADGATESSFAKNWAQILVKGLVTNSDCLLAKGRRMSKEACFLEWLAPLQKAWHEGIEWDSLPWFAEEKARSGAFTTLLGLQLDHPKPQGLFQTWHALAVGDAVLFHVRGNAMRLSFPLTSPSDFGNTPALLCSNQSKNGTAWKAVRIKRGTCRPGDTLFLCTDAIAQWFLYQCQEGKRPWEVLCGIGNQEEFEKLAAKLRAKQSMRNDDMTVVIINVS
jgi:hypothetical protein